jgi:cytochrome b561
VSNHEPNSTSAPYWKYAKPAVALHWVLAVLIACLLGIGWYMMSIEDDPGSEFFPS